MKKSELVHFEHMIYIYIYIYIYIHICDQGYFINQKA